MRDFRNTKNVLEKEGIRIFKTFGTTSNKPIVPKVNLLTCGNEVPIRHIEIILNLADELGIEYINISDNESNKNGIYIGSYGYMHGNVAKISELPIKHLIGTEQLTFKQFKNVVNSYLNYSFITEKEAS